VVSEPRLVPAEEMGENPSSSVLPGRIKESSLMWPMLDRTNYTEWAMLMQVNYEALEIWEVIEPGDKVK
jgi:hypothetical protein